jgi:hypothetical protein
MVMPLSILRRQMRLPGCATLAHNVLKALELFI